MTLPRFTVATFYKFVRLPDAAELRANYVDLCRKHDIRGTILLAQEGINATVAGYHNAVDQVLAAIRSDARFHDLDVKHSATDELPFRRMKVRLKKEIVTMGVTGINPPQESGTYVSPDEWNRLLADPDVVVIDTRNSYEVGIGAFEGAVNPRTDSFREFPKFVETELDPAEHRKIAMYCTGGIRCEKATAYLRRMGFDEVYHLQGGILKYLEETPPEDSRWNGECFVFDDRIALNQELQAEDYRLCPSCQRPIRGGSDCTECT